jgi:hypothetical protein
MTNWSGVIEFPIESCTLNTTIVLTSYFFYKPTWFIAAILAITKVIIYSRKRNVFGSVFANKMLRIILQLALVFDVNNLVAICSVPCGESPLIFGFSAQVVKKILVRIKRE